MWEGQSQGGVQGARSPKRGEKVLEMQEKAAMCSQQGCEDARGGILVLVNSSENECGQGCHLPLLSVLPFFPDLRTPSSSAAGHVATENKDYISQPPSLLSVALRLSYKCWSVNKMVCTSFKKCLYMEWKNPSF